MIFGRCNSRAAHGESDLNVVALEPSHPSDPCGHASCVMGGWPSDQAGGTPWLLRTGSISSLARKFCTSVFSHLVRGTRACGLSINFFPSPSSPGLLPVGSCLNLSDKTERFISSPNELKTEGETRLSAPSSICRQTAFK